MLRAAPLLFAPIIETFDADAIQSRQNVVYLYFKVLNPFALAMEDRACLLVIVWRLHLLGRVHEDTISSVAQILMIIFSCDNRILLHWAQFGVEMFSNWFSFFEWR